MRWFVSSDRDGQLTGELTVEYWEWEPIHPRRLLSLHTITFVTSIDSRNGMTLFSPVNLLSILPTETLCHINIVMAILSPPFDNDVWLDDLDITVKRFPNLQSVSVWQSPGNMGRTWKTRDITQPLPTGTTRPAHSLLQRDKVIPELREFLTEKLVYLRTSGLLLIH